MKGKYLIVCFIVITSFLHAQVLSGQKGIVKLVGEAPQETITAESAALVGKLDLTNRKFLFRQPLNTFSFSQGDLQKKHAEENFWEVDKFPNATFTGEIINDTDLSKDGTYSVTVRGKFKLHGIEKELKIPAVITLQNGGGAITSRFSIFLSDFNIKVPRLVSLKVAPEFIVDINLKITKP